MPIRGAEYAVDRVVAILQANLPAEFDLMDAVWADGLTLDDVANGDYFKVKKITALEAGSRAILVYSTGTDPIQIDSITNTPGRYVAIHYVTVEFHIKDTANEEPHLTQSRALRSSVAIERVLPIKNVTLGSTVTKIERVDRAEYDVQEGDEAGEFTRVCRIPFAVQVHENL